jgi:SAM-dependent methyltransferase
VLRSEGDRLTCPAGEAIPVRDGIPRFAGGSNYADHFGLQWNRYRSTQLDSVAGHSLSRDRLRRCMGEDLWGTLGGSRVLECGCGAGRFTEVLLAQGASVTSIDLSNAVDANALNAPIGPRHRIAQADIMALPFAPRSFDIVVCLGVVQHTPDPERSIGAMSEMLAPGGTLVIDHYTFSWGWYTKTAPLFRLWLRRLPPERSLRITDRLVDLLLPVHKAVARIPILSSIVWRLSPVLAYYREFPDFSDEQQRQWARLDTHDYLTDWYKHFRTRAQVRRALEGLGLTGIWCEYGGNGVEARGVRPVGPVSKLSGQPGI